MMNDPQIAGARGGSAPGIYVHVPFCRTKCPYCDFYSITSGTPVERWLEALASETALYRGAFGAFDTLYVGGGTPSVLSEREIGGLFEILTGGFDFALDPEITIEANPDDLTPSKLHAWRGLGINRVSLGVQSFDDAELRFLRRRHGAAQARAAIALLGNAGFPNVGIDLMYGYAGQSIESWERTLRSAVDCAPEHLSCYQLTIERSTEFGKMVEAGSLQALDEEAQREFFLRTSDTLRAAGYIHYEISNFAREERALSPHNRKYWRHVPYLGLGPSAHSFQNGKRWWNVRSVETYCRSLAQGGSSVLDSETLTEDELALETLYLGLRTRDGVPLEILSRYPNGERALSEALAQSLMRIENGCAVPTVKGFCLADRLAIVFAG